MPIRFVSHKLCLNVMLQILWEWWAPEHGFDKLPEVGAGVKKKLVKDFNYNFKYVPFLLKSTHANSCIEYDENSVLATSCCTVSALLSKGHTH